MARVLVLLPCRAQPAPVDCARQLRMLKLAPAARCGGLPLDSLLPPCLAACIPSAARCAASWWRFSSTTSSPEGMLSGALASNLLERAWAPRGSVREAPAAPAGPHSASATLPCALVKLLILSVTSVVTISKPTLVGVAGGSRPALCDQMSSEVPAALRRGRVPTSHAPKPQPPQKRHPGFPGNHGAAPVLAQELQVGSRTAAAGSRIRARRSVLPLGARLAAARGVPIAGEHASRAHSPSSLEHISPPPACPAFAACTGARVNRAAIGAAVPGSQALLRRPPRECLGCDRARRGAGEPLGGGWAEGL